MNSKVVEEYSMGAKRNYRYDLLRKQRYGVWCCDSCGKVTREKGCDVASHYPGCALSSRGLKGCVYHFGPRQVVEVIKTATKKRSDTASVGAISVAFLKRNFPELL